MSTYSITEQNYIKAIYHLQQKDNLVSTNQLSAALAVKASTATDMLKKLEIKKIVDYAPYKGFTLTSIGALQALQIIRRHRLWEFFLVKKLQIDWNEVHALAEELEHIDNNNLIDKLAKYLNNPQYDPHGDPIPDAHGNMPKNARIPITEIEIHKKARIEAVSNDSNAFLTLFDAYQLAIGKQIKITQVYEFDKSIQIQVGSQTLTLSYPFAQQILVTEVK